MLSSLKSGFTKKKLRDFNLASSYDDKSIVKRIKIEAIDFDWIFTGDNAKNMVNILADNASTKLLVQKSVRVFIHLIWKQFKS